MDVRDITSGIGEITSGQKYEAYAKRTDGLMLGLAALFLVIWSLTSIATGLPLRLGRALLAVNGLIWLVFAADLVVRIVIAKNSWRFIVKHPLDVLAVAVPMLRPLKILTIFTQGTRMVTSRGVLQTGQAVIASAALLVWVGAVAIFNAEADHANAQITSFGDSLWWSVVTITTVGYGDFAPVTIEGRIIAVGLMVVGIAILGVVTASVAAWFVRLTAEKKESDEGEGGRDRAERQAGKDVKRLTERVARLEEKIDRLLERESGQRR